MEINIEQYLSKVKVNNRATLLPFNVDKLLEGKCPLCYRKLYWTADKKKGYCKSKLRDKFFISREAYSRMGGA